MTEETQSFTRRGFLKFTNLLLTAAGLTAFGVPLVAFFWPKDLQETPSEPVPVGKSDSIPSGESVTIPYGRYPAIVINLGSEGLVAYKAVCTHFACIVNWNQEEGLIECPCHEGYFLPEDGSVLSGPPPLPLESLPIKVEDDTLFVGGES
jgi:Rieske Fe-S protein